MDFAQILKIIWDRKLWLGAILMFAAFAAMYVSYRIDFDGIEPRSHTYGAAQVQFFIDSPSSSLIDLTQDTEALATRAQLYAQFMRSNAIREAIARTAGIDARQIIAEAPPGTNFGQPVANPSGTSSDRTRGRRYRLVFDPQLGLPIVTVWAEAPTAAEAIRLADATVAAVRSYVDVLEAAERVPDEDKTLVRELGPAEGGTVNPGVDPVITLLTFCGVLLLGSGLLVGIVGLRRSFRRFAEAAKMELGSSSEGATVESVVAVAEAVEEHETAEAEPGGLRAPRVARIAARLASGGSALTAETASSRNLAFKAVDRLVAAGAVDEVTADELKDGIEAVEPAQEHAGRRI